MMKKQLATILGILMIALSLIMFSGCSQQSEIKQNEIIGSWETTIDMADMINKGFAEDEEMGEYLSINEFDLVVQVTFKEDGTYKMNVDEDAAEESFGKAQEDLVEGFEKYLEQIIKDSGMDMTVEEALTSSGSSMDELLEEVFGEEMLNALIEELETEGNFEAKDGKLFMSDGMDNEIDEDEYETYEIDGDELKLLEAIGGDADEEDFGLYPMTFKRTDA